MIKNKKGIFVTATGTDVGKTYVTALIIKKLRESSVNAGYYKAALSGAYRKAGKLIPGDAEYVATTSGIPLAPEALVSYIYEPAVSPHLAAELEKRPIELQKILSDFHHAATHFDVMIAEGSGGIVCPLRMGNNTIMLTNVIQALQLPVLIVANAELGTINSTVLTAAYAQQQNISVKGIILNQYDCKNLMHRDNKKQIERLTNIPIVACVSQNETNLSVSTETLLNLCNTV